MQKVSKKNSINPLFILLILVLAGMLYFIFQKQNSQISFQQPRASTNPLLQRPTIVPMPTIGSVEYPPLYPGIEWEAPAKIQMEVVKQSQTGIINTSVKADQIQSVLLTQNPLDNKKFWNYYSNALKVQGWDEYQLNDSSGPQGAIQFWINKGHYFGIGWREEYNGTPQKDINGKSQNIIGYRIFIEYN